jgi:hypothetical protein
VHPTETALEIAEIAGLIAEGATVVTVAQLAAAVLTPITIGLAILNANETDKRIAGMQAIGYALAAWAFGQEIPQFPAQLRTNFSHFPGKQALPPVEAAWRETASKTVANIELEAKKKNRSVKSYQAFWRGLGEGDPKQVVRLVRDARAEELYGPEKVSFLALDPARYPN